MKYILASASERRQELLNRIIDNFDIIISDFDEEKVKFNGNVEEYVIEVAEGKALDVLSRISEDSIIIAADTIVVNGDKILVVCNFYDKEVDFNFEGDFNHSEILLSNYKDSSTLLENLTLRPYEAIMYRIK